MKKTTVSLLREIIYGKKYFSVNAVKSAAREQQLSLNPLTINQYLSTLKKNYTLYSAGRGWYSTVAEEYQPDITIVRDLHNAIQHRFPLLKFSLWNTKQLQPFAHHLMTKFVTFVYADRDSLPSLSDFLIEEGERSILNPSKKDVEKYFDPASCSNILRPTITRAPVEGNYAKIEKILVDLFIEKDRILLMDGEEYRNIFLSLIFSHRINMGRMLEYAERRKIEDQFIKSLLELEIDSILIERRNPQ